MRTYVVPVALALLQGSALELEGTSPATGLLGVLGKRELTLVAVPGTEQVHGLAVGGSAESEVELDSGHCDVIFLSVEIGIMMLIILSNSSGAKLMDRRQDC